MLEANPAISEMSANPERRGQRLRGYIYDVAGNELGFRGLNEEHIISDGEYLGISANGTASYRSPAVVADVVAATAHIDVRRITMEDVAPAYESSPRNRLDTHEFGFFLEVLGQVLGLHRNCVDRGFGIISVMY